MVLQKAAVVPVWGRAAPGATVTVALAGKNTTAQAGPDGKWQANLDLSSCGPGPYEMAVTGPNRIVIKDVLVGEVWVTTGQSNMDFHLRSDADAPREIAQSDNPGLRQFFIKKVLSPSGPRDDMEGKWLVSSPANAPEFCAIGYYFARRLQKDLGRPVGLLNFSYSGAFFETWLSSEAFANDPALKADRDRELQDYESYPARHAAYAAAFRQWQRKFGREDRPFGSPGDYASASFAGWQAIKLPGLFAPFGLPDTGVVWLKKQVTISPGGTGQSLRLDLGTITGFTSVFWNGVKIGETTCDTARLTEKGLYTYEVPGNLVKAGPAELAVRVFSPQGHAGIVASDDGFRLVEDDKSQFLAGDWLARPEYSLPPLDLSAAQARPIEPEDPPRDRNLGSALFNGMIYPAIPYAIRGVISYQGERNPSYSAPYGATFALLIQDWRTHWNRPDLPYYFCQLPNLGPKDSTPTDGERARLREAQTATLALPHTGQAVLIDVGEEKDNHPRNKRETAERLALIALAETYGRDISFSGPVYQSMGIEGGKIRLHFTHLDGGLVARPLPASYQPRSTDPATVPLLRNSPGSELEGFAICGADHHWVWADASVDSDTVVVSSPSVSNPVAVRYAWSANPTCNLYNGAGLPAGPFRTDRFPGVIKP